MSEPLRLAGQPWMACPATRAVVDALAEGGAEVRFVGGCVRDAIAGRQVKDIDLATPLEPEAVIRRIEAAGLKAVPTGLAHGTITAVSGGRPYEITTLRHDVETFGRHARVAFTDDWVADAARRDFTMNALSCEPEGLVHDPFGGVADLRAGRVRFVGDAHARIEEDVLRLLRFFRFHAWYGRGAPDADGLAACIAMAGRLPDLSAERVRAELLRLLAAPDPADTVAVMAEGGVLEPVLAEPVAPGRLGALVRLEQAHGIDGAPVRRLAALVLRETPRMATLAEALRLSRLEGRWLGGLGLPHPELGADRVAIRRALHAVGDAGLYRDLALIAAADREAEPLSLRLAVAAEGPPPAFPLRGADLVARGVPRGPAVGRLLAGLKRWWIDRDFAPSRADCLAELERRLAAGERP
jgi:poly(A) polymerase